MLLGCLPTVFLTDHPSLQRPIQTLKSLHSLAQCDLTYFTVFKHLTRPAASHKSEDIFIYPGSHLPLFSLTVFSLSQYALYINYVLELTWCCYLASCGQIMSNSLFVLSAIRARLLLIVVKHEEVFHWLPIVFFVKLLLLIWYLNNKYSLLNYTQVYNFKFLIRSLILNLWLENLQFSFLYKHELIINECKSFNFSDIQLV